MTAPAIITFAETAALYAVLTEDLAAARRIVDGMLPSERAQTRPASESVARAARPTLRRPHPDRHERSH
ncbi:hypothetical protein [Streptomyces zaehneri]|uniref:hypothetical protein n=1 Tax=Streptomyces zaehneri TaxID=3051180 RepID=UPI0028D6183A|nr:hypothetical protein [Streptomyces sp. DSM 40713]